ncbi:hypothetical protein [Sphingomonas sp.]|uniref:hypothetical protein n=1 Tax=Sphingomonas sp. TaxID=28214 RepID=UPI001DD23507|nr:hypothetical protein [Sphingomonas sp.]MBX9796656.1 hypothetical protein [Sphingomonas sp.]
MRLLISVAAAAALFVATPVLAYKLIAQGQPVVAAKAITVTPSREWTRIGFAQGKNAESWTLDGLTLNDLTFYGGIAHDTTLIKDRAKKETPLPRFSKTMLPTDVAQLFEGTYRIALRTSQFTIGTVEPTTFAGRPGFKFTYSYALINEEVRRNGEAYGAIAGDRLYLVTFEAPVIHYFDRDVADFRALVGTAQITG